MDKIKIQTKKSFDISCTQGQREGIKLKKRIIPRALDQQPQSLLNNVGPKSEKDKMKPSNKINHT